MIIDENNTTKTIDLRNAAPCYNHPHLPHWEGELHKITTSPSLLAHRWDTFSSGFRIPHTNLSATRTTVGTTTLLWFE